MQPSPAELFLEAHGKQEIDQGRTQPEKDANVPISATNKQNR